MTLMSSYTNKVWLQFQKSNWSKPQSYEVIMQSVAVFIMSFIICSPSDRRVRGFLDEISCVDSIVLLKTSPDSVNKAEV